MYFALLLKFLTFFLGIVSMIVAGDFKFSLQICCCVNISDFKRGLNSHIKRKPIDLLHLISQWVSVPAEVYLFYNSNNFLNSPKIFVSW